MISNNSLNIALYTTDINPLPLTRARNGWGRDDELGTPDTHAHSLPLITTNCAVLGVTMLVLQKVTSTTAYEYTYLPALINAFGAGIGFLVARGMFAGVRGKLENADIPKSLKGLPITLVAAALVSLSFLGFAGFVDKLIPLG